MTMEFIPGSPMGSVVDPDIVYKMSGSLENFQFGVYNETANTLRHRFMTLDNTDGHVGLGNITDPTSRLTIRSGC